MLILGLILLFAAVAFLPSQPGVSLLLLLALAAMDKLVGFGDDSRPDYVAAGVFTLALGATAFYSVEGVMRLMGA